MHITVGGGDTAVTHRDSELEHRLRKRGPKVPVVVGASHIRSGITLDGVVQIDEFFGSRKKIRACCCRRRPSSLLRCKNLTAKPRMSRSASAAPRSPATVEKRIKIFVFLPISEKTYRFRVLGDVMSHGEFAKELPDPFACMRPRG